MTPRRVSPGSGPGRRLAAAERMAACGALALLLIPGCDRLPTGPAAAPRSPIRGITLVDWSAGGYATPASMSALAAVAATGANTAMLIVTAYQSDRSASALRSADPRTPTAAAVRQALEAARGMGLGVALKPHVDLDDGSWRGTIAPADVDGWFRSYRAFILPWASLAESVGAAPFVIGTELAGTLDHAALWRETVREVRAVYTGPLVYAASWDEAGRVRFWGDLDLVGVDAYFPVAARRDPGRLDLVSGWQPWLERVRLLSRQTGRKVLFTEIGYASVDGAGMHPYRSDAQDRLDLGEQADLYWAALEATADAPWLAGLCWWNWPADGSGGPGNRDYTPDGKPAVQELANAWAGAAVAAVPEK